MMPSIMKLNKHLNRKVGKTEYHKYSLNIPQKIREELNWDETTELKMKIVNDKLVIDKD